jgi:hypothetical protein
MRLKTESKRLLVRILSGEHDQYKVMSQHGRITIQWPTKELNKVSNDLTELLGGNIPIETEYKAGKEVQIQLTKAVALGNNCGSITAAQKAGRRANKTTADSESGSKSETETELVNALATTTNAVSAASNALASSPPARQPN